MTRLLRVLGISLALLPLAACPRPDQHEVITPVDPQTLPDLVEFSSAISRPALEPDQAQEVFARLRAQGMSPQDSARPRVNLALALDVSGSMEGQALADAKAAAGAMVDKLAPGDRLSIVAFGGATQVVFSGQNLTAANRRTAHEAIEKIEARGTTDMAGGLYSALDQAQTGAAQDGVNRIVLLSDGVPNDASTMGNLADSARAQNITITSLGLGQEFDETLLTMLAQRSGGRYHYIEDSGDAVAVFDEELLHLEHTVAQGLTLALRAGPGVRLLEVIGHPINPGAQASLSLGDLADGETKDILVRLEVGPHHEGSHAELLDATWSFGRGVTGVPGRDYSAVLAQTEDDYLSAKVGGDVDAEARTSATAVELDVVRATAAASMVQVAALSRSGQVQQAKDLLAQVIAATQGATKKWQDPDLDALLEEMKHLQDTWPTQAAIAVDAGQSPDQVSPGHPEPGRPVSGQSVPAPQPEPKALRKSHAKAIEVLY